MRYFQAVFILFLISLSGLSFSAASPQSRLDEIIARGVLKVGTPGDYSPFSFTDPKTGAFTGLDIDQAQSLATALGVRLEIVETSWPTLTQDFRDDKFDIAMGGVSITLERQKIGLFSHPIWRMERLRLHAAPTRINSGQLPRSISPASRLSPIRAAQTRSSSTTISNRRKSSHGRTIKASLMRLPPERVM
ncbi:transporter substrate-binding domain-containing protein [Brucella intermedia]|uniref:transporter substrate-binding domain-containing protein n=1 Tax=Brucella intermedia TaxID=94625 RepID=UPI0030814310